MNAACLFAGLGDALVWEHEGLKCIHGARERLWRQDPAVLSPPQAGQLAHLGNVTEHIGAQQADWEKQRPPGWVRDPSPAQTLRNPNALADRGCP